MTLTSCSRQQEGLDCWKIRRSLLSALYLLIEWTNFSQTYTNILFGGETCWLDFGDLDPIFKVTGGLRLLENGLSASYLLKEWIDFNQTCTSVLLGHAFRTFVRFVLVWICRFPLPLGVWEGLRIVIVALPGLFSYLFLTKIVQIYCWDMEKKWLDFGDLDPIFKVTVRLKLLENCLSAPYRLNEWMDFDQTCTS